MKTCKDLILQCDCHGEHFIILTCYHEPDDTYPGFLTIEGCFGSCGDGWWQRVKAAWSALRNQHPCWASVVLNKDTVDPIRVFLEEHGPHLFSRQEKAE